MGIQDRDYMRRPRHDEDRGGSSPDAKLEAFFSRLFQRRKRLLVGAGLVLLALLLVAIVVAVAGNR